MEVNFGAFLSGVIVFLGYITDDFSARKLRRVSTSRMRLSWSLSEAVDKMYVGVCRVTLHLPANHSLKGKRQVVHSVCDRLRNRFGVSVAEIGGHERWQRAVLAVATVSGTSSTARTMLDRVSEFVESSFPDLIVTDVETDVLDLT